MANWCKQKNNILALATWLVLGGSNPPLAAQNDLVSHGANTSNLPKIDLKTNLWLAKSVALCEEKDSSYREIHSFETEYYYINICQGEDNFYYYRQSKADANNAFVAPAQSAFGGDVFQATYDEIIYLVGQNGDRYYSSVMQNNSEIVFEPELEPPTLSADVVDSTTSEPDVAVNNNTLNSELEDKSSSNIESASKSGIDSTNQFLICAGKESELNPNLHGWEKLIGQSADAVNQYALSNGHNFIYGDDAEDVQIKTNDGKIINLNIANASKTIERVCVQSVAQR